MNRIHRLIAGAALPVLLPFLAAGAQAPCDQSRVLVDSAKAEVISVLTSDGIVAKEIRQENGLPPKDLPPINVVSDAAVCSRLSTLFGHAVNRGDKFVVLQIGPLYYAREPYQRRGTGILTDTAYKVVARLGVPVK